MAMYPFINKIYLQFQEKNRQFKYNVQHRREEHRILFSSIAISINIITQTKFLNQKLQWL